MRTIDDDPETRARRMCARVIYLRAIEV